MNSKWTKNLVQNLFILRNLSILSSQAVVVYGVLSILSAQFLGSQAVVAYGVLSILSAQFLRSQAVVVFITQPSIYGVIVFFLLCHESLNYSTGQ